ncbi:MAG: hypothetical protein ACJA2A_002064 [Cycloclasticus pugetii]|jgi:hypothetical protein
MINWEQCALNLRRVMPLSLVAKKVNMDADTLRRLSRGETKEPKFTAGVLLLDLHWQLCADRHAGLMAR